MRYTHPTTCKDDRDFKNFFSCSSCHCDLHFEVKSVKFYISGPHLYLFGKNLHLVVYFLSLICFISSSLDEDLPLLDDEKCSRLVAQGRTGTTRVAFYSRSFDDSHAYS
ncbi:unnamed protein product [Victoria cruziana]